MIKLVLLLALIIAFALPIAYKKTSKTETIYKVVPSPAQKEANARATFIIFTNGTKRDFAFERYYNQSRDVYIDASDSTVINVKRAGVTWDEFFKSLPMKLEKDCLTTGTNQVFCTNDTYSLKFYINDKEEPNFLSREIKDKDRALIRYGTNDPEAIQSELDQVPTLE